MDNGDHRIKRLRFSLQLTNQQDVVKLQDAASEISSKELPDLMDRVFSEFVPKGQLVRIDKLRVDIGEVTKEQLQQQLLTGIEAALRKYLNKLPPPAKNTALVENTSATAKNSNQWDELEIIKFYLENGILPWGASDFSTSKPSEIINEFIKKRPAALRDFLKTSMAIDNRVLHRLQLQLPATIYEKLVIELVNQSSIADPIPSLDASPEAATAVSEETELAVNRHSGKYLDSIHNEDDDLEPSKYLGSVDSEDIKAAFEKVASSTLGNHHYRSPIEILVDYLQFGSELNQPLAMASASRRVQASLSPKAIAMVRKSNLATLLATIEKLVEEKDASFLEFLYSVKFTAAARKRLLEILPRSSAEKLLQKLIGKRWAGLDRLLKAANELATRNQKKMSSPASGPKNGFTEEDILQLLFGMLRDRSLPQLDTVDLATKVAMKLGAPTLVSKQASTTALVTIKALADKEASNKGSKKSDLTAAIRQLLRDSNDELEQLIVVILRAPKKAEILFKSIDSTTLFELGEWQLKAQWRTIRKYLDELGSFLKLRDQNRVTIENLQNRFLEYCLLNAATNSQGKLRKEQLQAVFHSIIDHSSLIGRSGSIITESVLPDFIENEKTAVTAKTAGDRITTSANEAISSIPATEQRVIVALRLLLRQGLLTENYRESGVGKLENDLRDNLERSPAVVLGVLGELLENPPVFERYTQLFTGDFHQFVAFTLAKKTGRKWVSILDRFERLYPLVETQVSNQKSYDRIIYSRLVRRILLQPYASVPDAREQFQMWVGWLAERMSVNGRELERLLLRGEQKLASGRISQPDEFVAALLNNKLAKNDGKKEKSDQQLIELTESLFQAAKERRQADFRQYFKTVMDILESAPNTFGKTFHQTLLEEKAAVDFLLNQLSPTSIQRANELFLRLKYGRKRGDLNSMAAMLVKLELHPHLEEAKKQLHRYSLITLLQAKNQLLGYQQQLGRVLGLVARELFISSRQLAQALRGEIDTATEADPERFYASKELYHQLLRTASTLADSERTDLEITVDLISKRTKDFSANHLDFVQLERALVFYLKRGHFPWWFGQELTVEELLEQLVKLDSRQLVGRTSVNPGPYEKLGLLISPASIDRVLKIHFGGFSSFISFFERMIHSAFSGLSKHSLAGLALEKQFSWAYFTSGQQAGSRELLGFAVDFLAFKTSLPSAEVIKKIKAWIEVKRNTDGVFYHRFSSLLETLDPNGAPEFTEPIETEKATDDKQTAPQFDTLLADLSKTDYLSVLTLDLLLIEQVLLYGALPQTTGSKYDRNSVTFQLVGKLVKGEREQEELWRLLRKEANAISRQELEARQMNLLDHHQDSARKLYAGLLTRPKTLRNLTRLFSGLLQYRIAEVLFRKEFKWLLSFWKDIQLLLLQSPWEKKGQLLSSEESTIEHLLYYGARQRFQKFSKVDYSAHFIAFSSKKMGIDETALRKELTEQLNDPPSGIELDPPSLIKTMKRPPTKRQNKKKKSMNTLENLLAEGLVISNAGLVILGPFLPRFYKELGLMEGNQFIDEEAKIRGAQLLQFALTGSEESPEHLMLFNKICCGLPVDTPIPPRIEPTEAEQDVCTMMLNAILQNWEKMNTSTVENLRGSFLLRDGLLRKQEDHWSLTVESRGFDIILTFLPWTISIISLPWLEERIEVNWKTTA